MYIVYLHTGNRQPLIARFTGSIHGSYNLEKVLNVSSHLEKPLNLV